MKESRKLIVLPFYLWGSLLCVGFYSISIQFFKATAKIFENSHYISRGKNMFKWREPLNISNHSQIKMNVLWINTKLFLELIFELIYGLILKQNIPCWFFGLIEFHQYLIFWLLHWLKWICYNGILLVLIETNFSNWFW